MTASGSLVHDALLYATTEDLLAAVVPFAAEGVRAGDAVMAVVAERNLEPLAEALAAELAERADEVTLVAAEAWYERPAHTIAGYGEVLDRYGAERRRVRVIGEVDFGTLPLEQRDWIRYEAVLNHLFAERDAWVLCPYDVSRLPYEVVESAARTHPRLVRDGQLTRSVGYGSPEQVLRTVTATPLPPTATLLLSMRLTPELAALRATVQEAATACGLDRHRAQQFVLALNEVATNALVHGRGGGTVRLWRHDDGLVCEVSDNGPGLTNLLAGYTPPDDVAAEGGFGLWLARQLSDTLEVVPGPGGTTVRLGVLAQPVSR